MSYVCSYTSHITHVTHTTCPSYACCAHTESPGSSSPSLNHVPGKGDDGRRYHLQVTMRQTLAGRGGSPGPHTQLLQAYGWCLPHAGQQGGRTGQAGERVAGPGVSESGKAGIPGQDRAVSSGLGARTCQCGVAGTETPGFALTPGAGCASVQSILLPEDFRGALCCGSDCYL